jgi:hypothetical protein
VYLKALQWQEAVYVSVAEEGDGGVGRVISGLGEGDEVEESEDIVWFFTEMLCEEGNG